MNFSVAAVALLVVLTVHFIDSQETSPPTPPSPPSAVAGRWPWGPKPWHCRPHHHGFFMIPGCEQFSRDMKEEMEALKNNGSESCRTLSTWAEKENCKFEQLMDARSNVVPAETCMQNMVAFATGITPSTTVTTPTPTTPTPTTPTPQA
uniref:U7-Hexatoxin-Hf1c_1 n=1 Tax=Hadronyche formidabilis TaxID=426499 RepID=A0A4Q8K8V1_HADFO